MKYRAVRYTIRTVGVIICASLMMLYYSPTMRMVRALPEDVHLMKGDEYVWPITLSGAYEVDDANSVLAASSTEQETLYEATGGMLGADASVNVRFMGIPVKEVNLHVRENIELVPGGSSVGVSLYTRGALVVGVGSVNTTSGELSPAASAGLRQGDVITKINGEEIMSASHLAELCNESEGDVLISYERSGHEETTRLKGVLDIADDTYRMGLWVRDSTAGIGTLSFYDPTTGWYAALGHAVMDADTQSNLTVREGEIVQSSIVDIVQGAEGAPGELRGTFGVGSLPLGSIVDNGDFGIYGRMYQPYYNSDYSEGIELGYPEEVREGEATILTMLDDTGIQEYECRIIKLNEQSIPTPKGMVVEITDPALLEKTGGVVQGMSGSPLLQDGKLVGVVTHVFVNDPTKGYCMYAQWMHEQILGLVG